MATNNNHQATADYKMITDCALGIPGMKNATDNLKKLRLEKADKPGVVIISAQKAGSTLLCYICALLNTKNTITKFRNDFDILPMLSFPTYLIAQNFNARQDGVYQMYKINGTIKQMDPNLGAVKGLNKIIWSCREFPGYYRSVYWRIKEFYPRIGLESFRSVTWDMFQDLTFDLMAEDHVEELWYAYNRIQATDPKEFLPLVYEHTTKEKVATIHTIAEWLGINISEENIKSIAEKTTKEAMAVGDKFDPVAYGDGGGLSKVNLKPHTYMISDNNLMKYQARFEERFREVGIYSYSDFSTAIREHHAEQFRRSH